MKRTAFVLIAAVMLASAAGCFLFAPRINLERLGTIGFVQLHSEAKGHIAEYATQVFLEIMLRSQPRARIKELGREAAILHDLDANRFSPEVLAELGRRSGIDVLLLGTLDISNVKPRLDVATILSTLSVSAVVDAGLSARLIDLRDGTTLWTGSARKHETVANVTVGRGGDIFFDAGDPEQAYGPLIRDLVLATTRDFQRR